MITYHEVIQGSASYEDADVGIDQLRTEAGREGLRAKALEAEVLRPIVRDAGGPQALVAQTQSFQRLLERVGGMQKLNEMVLDGQLLRIRVDEVGGVDGLDNLIERCHLLDIEQQDHSELRAQVLGKHGLRDKARKYDELQKAFAAVEGGSVDERSPDNAPGGIQRSQRNPAKPRWTKSHASKPITQAPRNDLSSQVAVKMNPARARLLTSTPPRGDPNRDLYEPKPPARDSSRKTGSNDIPLGRPRIGKLPAEQGLTNVATGMKRKHEQEPQNIGAKRPRVDIGRASALLQASLTATGADSALVPLNAGRSQATAGCPSIDNSKELNEKPSQNSGVEQAFKQRVGDVHHRAAESVESRGEDVEMNGPAYPRADRSSVDNLLGTTRPARGNAGLGTEARPLDINLEWQARFNKLLEKPVVKKEDTSDDPQATRSDPKASRGRDNLAAGTSDQGSTKMMVGGYPIALWIGGSNPTSRNPTDLVKANDIPPALASFLSAEMKKHLNNTDLKLWDDMKPNSDTCILRYLADGHIFSGMPQERRACRSCSSAWVSDHRPCAMLDEVDGVRTVVFMPLRDALRRGVAWTERRFWVMDLHVRGV
jgi:hypothetical protein